MMGSAQWMRAGGLPYRTLINYGAPRMDGDMKGVRIGFSLLFLGKWGALNTAP